MLAKRTGKGRVAVANPDVERELALLQAQRGSPAAVQALAAAIEERDNYTHEHSERGRPPRPRRRHDARAGRPTRSSGSRTPRCCTTSASSRSRTSILHKAGPLTARRVGGHGRAPGGRRAHPRCARPELVAIAPLVRHEHEHWDGSGYPDGLAGLRIPLGSRIILACDAYNAMITSRPYRDAMEPRGRARRAAPRRRAPVRPRGRRRAAGPARRAAAVPDRAERSCDARSVTHGVAGVGSGRVTRGSRSAVARSASRRRGCCAVCVTVSLQRLRRRATRARCCRREQLRQRRRPGRRRQRDHVALLDVAARGRAGTARSGRSRARAADDRALARPRARTAACRAQHREPGRRRRRARALVEERDLPPASAVPSAIVQATIRPSAGTVKRAALGGPP